MQEREYIAKNGLRAYLFENEAQHGFVLSLFVRAGSIYDSEDESGISHFLEHIAIRNVHHLMGGTLYSLLDKYGLEFNASTFNEMIQFYVSGATANFSLAAGFISNLLSPLVLSTEEVSLERERIKAEIRESDDKTSLSTFSNNTLYHSS